MFQEPNSGDRPILYLGIVPFHSIRQRPQHIATCLSMKQPVIYVEPTRSVLGLLRKLGQKNTLPAESVPSRLRIHDPGYVWPLSGYFPSINRWNYRGKMESLCRDTLRSGYQWPPKVIIATFPKHIDAVRYIPNVPVIYDVMDDYPLFFDQVQGKHLQQMHEDLVAKSRIVIASSQTLAVKCRKLHDDVRVITNGVGAELFDACASCSPAPEILTYPGPRMGYIGAISEWFDFDAVRTLATANPTGSVVLVGPCDTAIPPLPDNVHFLGAKPYRQLPQILKGFDVGIIPFKRSEKIDAVNPVKVYEYFAANLPVISSEFTEILAFGDLVHVCRKPLDWKNAMANVRSQATPQFLQSLRQHAAKNLWTQKANAFYDVFSHSSSRSIAA